MNNTDLASFMKNTFKHAKLVNLFVSFFVNRLLQQNACLYWLPCVLKCIPESLSYVLEKLRDAHDKEKSENNTSEDTRFLSAYLSVLKVSRSLAILQTDDLVSDQLTQTVK